MPFERTSAVCLRTIDFSETSQVLRFFTRERGRIGCIAKGAKRRKSAFLAPFVSLAVYDLIRIEKRPGTLDIVTQAERVRVFPGLPKRYERFVAASYAAEFVDEFAPEGQPVEGLYELLLEALERLDGAVPVPDAAFSFEVRALKALGYLPRVRECGICRRPIARPDALFSASDGGAACLECRTRDDRWFPVRRAVLESIARFGQGDMPRETVKPALAVEIRAVLDASVRYHLERELKAARLLRDALAG